MTAELRHRHDDRGWWLPVITRNQWGRRNGWHFHRWCIPDAPIDEIQLLDEIQYNIQQDINGYYPMAYVNTHLDMISLDAQCTSIRFVGWPTEIRSVGLPRFITIVRMIHQVNHLISFISNQLVMNLIVLMFRHPDNNSHRNSDNHPNNLSDSALSTITPTATLTMHSSVSDPGASI